MFQKVGKQRRRVKVELRNRRALTVLLMTGSEQVVEETILPRTRLTL